MIKLKVVSIPFNRPDSVEPETKVWESDWFGLQSNWRINRIDLILLVTVVRPVAEKLLNANQLKGALMSTWIPRMALEGNDELSLLASQAESEEPIFGLRNGQLVYLVAP